MVLAVHSMFLYVPQDLLEFLVFTIYKLPTTDGSDLRPALLEALARKAVEGMGLSNEDFCYGGARGKIL